MVQAVILEDRPSHREHLLALLKGWPQADRLEVRCADGPQALRDMLLAAPVDILLTDIDLGAGQHTGIQLVQELFPADSGTQIIYITGYPLRFCTEVYQTEHIYFLTKPLRQEELLAALDRAAANLSRREDRRIVIRSAGRVIPLSTAHIHYVESDRRLAQLHTLHGTVESYLSLTQLLPQLGPAFVQCHKSFLVNMGQVAQMEADCLRLKDGSRIPISQSHRRTTRNTYMAYLARQL